MGRGIGSGNASPQPVAIAVARVDSAMQQRIIAEIDTGDDVGSRKGDLFGFGEKVVRIARSDRRSPRREVRPAAGQAHVRSLVELWPKAPSSAMSDGINAATKYIATRRPESLAWGPFESPGSDVVEGIRRVKAQDGPNLVLSGSTSLTSTLLEHALADEVLPIVYPVLLGHGKRFFAEGTPPRSLEPASTQALTSGLVVNA
jgi:hypothetical protein